MAGKKIVIITTAQPSTNPRMVKEYLALKGVGYNVTVLYCYSVYWAEAADKELFTQYNLDSKDFILIGGSPTTEKFSYFISRLRKKIADKFFPNSLNALFRTSAQLYQAAPRHKADLYIAHNIGALPTAVHAAKRNKAKVAFDAEDYHRGEITLGKLLFEKNSKVEDRYFPQLSYFTAASPMILEQYQKLFPALKGICINNVFPKSVLDRNVVHKENDGTLKLWWFSQKIGRGRGLEDIIKAVGLSGKNNVHITFIGIIADDIREMLTKLATDSGMKADQLHILAPVSEVELFRIGQTQDIGLALEIGEPDNRKYCLTNKIFTYLLASNAIIFSDSLSQKVFWEEHPECGSLYERGNIEQLAAIINKYATDATYLQHHKNVSSQLAATTYNWEMESKKLVDWVSKYI